MPAKHEPNNPKNRYSSPDVSLQKESTDLVPGFLQKRTSPRNTATVDYKTLNDGATSTYSDIIHRMENATYSSDFVVTIENAIGLTKSSLISMLKGDEYFVPLLIKNKEGLGMHIPNSDIKVQNISEIIGSDTLVSVIDVESNEDDGQWTLKKWAKYYEAKDKKKIYNVISLEISHTKLGDSIQRPSLVDNSDLITNCWPKRRQNRGDEYPKVQLYCLMSPESSYTDFHVDFSATWVYYHVLSGEKVFYLVPPTDEYLQAYEQWCSSEEQLLSMFTTCVGGQVGRVVLKPGNTLIIPAGWIHAVSTLKDSIVIGGNYLMLETMEMHIKMYKMESRLGISETYRLPYFLSLCDWVVLNIAKHLKSLKGPQNTGVNSDAFRIDKDSDTYQLVYSNIKALIEFISSEIKPKTKALAKAKSHAQNNKMVKTGDRKAIHMENQGQRQGQDKVKAKANPKVKIKAESQCEDPTPLNKKPKLDLNHLSNSKKISYEDREDSDESSSDEENIYFDIEAGILLSNKNLLVAINYIRDYLHLNPPKIPT